MKTSLPSQTTITLSVTHRRQGSFGKVTHVVILMPNSITNMPMVSSGFRKGIKVIVTMWFRWNAQQSFHQG
uniref:Uncharacterized protein n=1 Tax=Arundo donax TaxID=35708 RepID=A0A0A9E6P8_ARUDO